ncbi:MAG: AAA family ATPase [Pseudomonadota bacterium]
MKLTKFRVRNYRSINDSGDIEVARITALLGRNESGKTNLLRALMSLNPPGGAVELDPVKDFPRHRTLTDCDDETLVVDTTWTLDDEDRAALASLWPRASDVENIHVSRCFGAETVRAAFSLSEIDLDRDESVSHIKKIVAGVKAAATKIDGEGSDTARATLEAEADTFASALGEHSDLHIWAKATSDAVKKLRVALASADMQLNPKNTALIDALDEKAQAILTDEKSRQDAHEWAVKQLPVFVYLDEYPEIPGHQDIESYLDRKQKQAINEADQNFEKLCKVAGLSPAELDSLLKNNEQEKRGQLANRAGSVVTTTIRRLWKDRPLKIRFGLDGRHFDTLVSDPNSTYDVEVNLNERSRGFQWFFAFYMVFAADTDDGSAAGAIILLDEPGLFLHARSQADLLKHLEDDFENQILFTTHSPFMVPTRHLDWVRTVNIGEEPGTTVTNTPTGDARTLFPLQAALGYDLVQSLFVGGSNLIVEGVTDFWILSTASEYLRELGRVALDERLSITPAGSAQKVPYLTSFLTSEKLDVLILLDQEKSALDVRDELVHGKMVRDSNVLFVSKAFADDDQQREADVEDLLDPELYEALVRESYGDEIAGVEIEINDNIPRIAKRFEIAFEAVELEFNKTRPLRLFLKRSGSDPESVFDNETLLRFERLFMAINSSFEAHLKRTEKADGSRNRQ